MRLHPIRTAVVLLAAFVLVAAAWMGWKAWNVANDLEASVDDARTLEAAARAGDSAGVDAALASLRDHSGSAADGTDGWSWSVLTRVPLFGDDARGVRTVSRVVADLSNSGLDDLAAAARDLDQLVPTNGRISIDALRSLEGPVDRGGVALSEASERLDVEDSSGYITRLRENYRELQDRVGDASRALQTADTALAVLPSMLGDGERRRYVLMVQNNAEVRATGGVPGAMSLVESEDGQIAMTRQTSSAAFAESEQPFVALTPAEKELYGPAFSHFMSDVTFTQDFPRSAELVQARWEQVYPEDDLDGVLSIDVVAASYLLAVTGPITVDGVELTESNAVDELLNGTYLRLSDPVAQDAFFAAVAKSLFDRVSSGVADPTALFQVLARATDEGRLYVNSFRPEEQAEFADRAIAGAAAKTSERSPTVDVTLNDTTGAKMSYYLRSQVHVTSTSCQSGRQRLSGAAELVSQAPADAAGLPGYITGEGKFGIAPGSQLVTVRVFGPVGGTITKPELNYEKTDVYSTTQDGRPVATFYTFLDPGQTVSLTWQMESGDAQTGDTELRVTPGIEPGRASDTVSTTCS